MIFVSHIWFILIILYVGGGGGGGGVYCITCHCSVWCDEHDESNADDEECVGGILSWTLPPLAPPTPSTVRPSHISSQGTVPNSRAKSLQSTQVKFLITGAWSSLSEGYSVRLVTGTGGTTAGRVTGGGNMQGDGNRFMGRGFVWTIRSRFFVS